MIIEIPFKTPSVNHLYTRHRYTGAKIMKSEAKKLKEEIILLCKDKSCDELLNNKLSIFVEIHEDWNYKNGNVKRADISNREKFLIDAVFDGLGLDDKMVFDHRMVKVQSDEEKAIIKINRF